MSGRHHDLDGDGVADQGLVDPFIDPQWAAFAHADPETLVTDDDIAVMHELGGLRDVTTGPVVGVAEHEDAQWDAERTGPKPPENGAESPDGAL